MNEKVKQSKFEKRAAVLLKGDENNDVLTERDDYRKAMSKINIQVAQLEDKKLELESKIAEANYKIEAQQLNINFDLKKYDNGCNILEEEYIDPYKIYRPLQNSKKTIIVTVTYNAEVYVTVKMPHDWSYAKIKQELAKCSYGLEEERQRTHLGEMTQLYVNGEEIEL